MSTLSEWSDIVQRQDADRRRAQAKADNLADKIIEELAKEKDLWWLDYTQGDSITFYILKGTDAEVRRHKQQVVQNVIFPVLRAAQNAGVLIKPPEDTVT